MNLFQVVIGGSRQKTLPVLIFIVLALPHFIFALPDNQQTFSVKVYKLEKDYNFRETRKSKTEEARIRHS